MRDANQGPREISRKPFQPKAASHMYEGVDFGRRFRDRVLPATGICHEVFSASTYLGQLVQFANGAHLVAATVGPVLVTSGKWNILEPQHGLKKINF